MGGERLERGRSRAAAWPLSEWQEEVLPYEGHSLMGGVGRGGEEDSLRYPDTGMYGMRVYSRQGRRVRGFDRVARVHVGVETGWV